jgi:hypothetical protein
MADNVPRLEGRTEPKGWTMTSKLPAHAAGTDKAGDAATVPDKITAPLDQPQEALQNAARAEAERNRIAHVLRDAGIDPNKLTPAEVGAAFGIIQDMTRADDAAQLATHKRRLEAFKAAHPHAIIKVAS